MGTVNCTWVGALGGFPASRGRGAVRVSSAAQNAWRAQVKGDGKPSLGGKGCRCQVKWWGVEARLELKHGSWREHLCRCGFRKFYCGGAWKGSGVGGWSGNSAGIWVVSELDWVTEPPGLIRCHPDSAFLTSPRSPCCCCPWTTH